MTNAMIILGEQIRLMNEGILSGTGVFMSLELEDGSKFEQEIPEDIHTFAGWKSRGYAVRKGEHAIAKFPIWKHTQKQKEAEDGGESEVETNMFMKTASFFKMSQVELIKEVING